MVAGPNCRVARPTALPGFLESPCSRYDKKFNRQRTLGWKQGDLQEIVSESRFNYLVVVDNPRQEQEAIRDVI